MGFHQFGFHPVQQVHKCGMAQYATGLLDGEPFHVRDFLLGLGNERLRCCAHMIPVRRFYDERVGLPVAMYCGVEESDDLHFRDPQFLTDFPFCAFLDAFTRVLFSLGYIPLPLPENEQHLQVFLAHPGDDASTCEYLSGGQIGFYVEQGLFREFLQRIQGGIDGGVDLGPVHDQHLAPLVLLGLEVRAIQSLRRETFGWHTFLGVFHLVYVEVQHDAMLVRGKIHNPCYLSVVIRHGIILAGGRSERFGRPKALVTLEGRSLVERAVENLSACVDHVAVSVGPASRRVVLPDTPTLAEIPLLEDRRLDAGPLAGLEAAAEWCAFSPLFVLAVDLPAVDQQTIRQLLDDPGSEACDLVCARAEVTGRLQPLCGIWSPRALREVSLRLDNGESAVFRCMEGLEVRSIPLKDAVLKNVNRPADLG